MFEFRKVLDTEYYTYYIVKDGDTLYSKKGIQYYITKEEDTLKSVSNIFGIKENDIVDQNKSIYLLPGQMIFYKE